MLLSWSVLSIEYETDSHKLFLIFFVSNSDFEMCHGRISPRCLIERQEEPKVKS